MKKFLNDPADVVAEALRGLARAHPTQLRVDLDQRIVYRAPVPAAPADPRSGPVPGPAERGRVALLSGGGSGHEPLHTGYVGPGMLDAACVGEIFTSPVPLQILAATREVDTGSGVLYIVKNYTGDVMNFEMAAELAAAEGIQTATVLVDDDVAVEDSLYTAGRRGVGLTLMVEKILGAAAAEGADLAHLVALGERTVASGASMGVALTSCIVPSAGVPTFDLGPREIEVGVGIHGEPGRRRAPHAPAAEIARLLVEPVLQAIPEVGAGSQMIILVNGLGGTPLMELYLMFDQIAGLLDEAGVQIMRSLVGNYLTSLEMSGCSLTALRADDELVRLWDAPVTTPSLRWGA